MADPRSTPTCAAASAKAPSSACEGREAKPSILGSSNLPVPRPIQFWQFPSSSKSLRGRPTKHPQPAPQRQRRRRVQPARGARRSRAFSAVRICPSRPIQFWQFPSSSKSLRGRPTKHPNLRRSVSEGAEFSLRGARGEAEHSRQFESARPDPFSFGNSLHPVNLFVADPRSTPTCAAASAKAPSPACEGREAKPSIRGSSNLPVPTHSLLSASRAGQSESLNRIAPAVDHGTNMTFVMYPKADSSRIVKRQGKEPM